MSQDSPSLDALVRRLIECPADFLAEPRLGQAGVVHVDAVVLDLMLELGGPPLTEAQAARFAPGRPEERPWLRVVLVACWLLDAPAFRSDPARAAPALAWLEAGLRELARLVPAEQFVLDADRREELARACLEALGLRPRGEGEAQAADRLKTISSVERERVVLATRATQERARELRRKMAEAAAQEAAARFGRE